MKKITALALGTIFALSTTLPLFAIEENLNNTKVEQKTTKKAFWNKKKKDLDEKDEHGIEQNYLSYFRKHHFWEGKR